MRVRKRPLVVDAEKTESLIHLFHHERAALPAWVLDAYHGGRMVFGHDLVFVRTTPGLPALASRGDWIIRGTRGEIYVCEAETFAEIYEFQEP